ncbi:hypothetical protein EJB05_07493, partial [Eragrostis curvula]
MELAGAAAALALPRNRPVAAAMEEKEWREKNGTRVLGAPGRRRFFDPAATRNGRWIEIQRTREAVCGSWAKGPGGNWAMVKRAKNHAGRDWLAAARWVFGPRLVIPSVLFLGYPIKPSNETKGRTLLFYTDALQDHQSRMSQSRRPFRP